MMIPDLQKWFARGPLQCDSQESADQWFEKEVGLVMAATGEVKDKAEALIRDHLGLASGFYDLDIARRVYSLWGAEHPYFGTPDNRAQFTKADLEQIMVSVYAVFHGQVEAQA